ncbi:unnamed protein product [Spirodela intermedia]|uniref:Uncharacterized protein n=1 Tax=Spirodela intermedia TaxID=51605 RepID=A0A7I8LIF1_SPIIN|nr:unnamed protein product [Spirodela intermedia]
MLKFFTAALLHRPPTRSSSLDDEWDPSPSAQETPVVRVQPDRRTKIKEPGLRYTG